MKNTLFGLAMVIAICSAVALAQQPRHEDVGRDPQMWQERRIDLLARRLNLTDSQKQQATTIFNAADEARKELRKSLEQAQEGLNNAVVKTGTTDEQVEKLARAMGTLVGQLAANDAKERTKLRAILTAEQRERFDQFPARGPGMMHGAEGGRPPRPGMGMMMHGFAGGPPPGPPGENPPPPGPPGAPPSSEDAPE